MQTSVDKFLDGATKWRDEMVMLRAVLLSVKLDENIKWRLPCYSHEGHNVAIIQPFKTCLALMFFKGTLLKDAKKMLVANGPNSQSSRRLEFRAVADIKKQSVLIRSYLKEAIEIELSGKRVKIKKRPTALPEEMKQAFRNSARLEAAFKALTPGRQRAYILHISGAKQAATRAARIAKLRPRILAGKGLNDR